MRFLLLLLLIASPAFAQSSGRFTITRSVVADGGTTFSSSARFQLGSTVAQPLAAVPGSARFSIQGGFWIQAAPIIYAPTRSGTNFIFSFQTEPGVTYIPQIAGSLANPNWQSLPAITGDGTDKAATNSAAGVSQQFYRLIQQP